MNTIRLSATSARNNFFTLLNQVSLGTQVIIEKDNKEIAMLVPKTSKTDWRSLRKALKATRGILKDYSASEIAPASGKKVQETFGEWDKEMLLNDK